MEEIAIINEQNEIIGYKDKLLVHEQGLYHRAFSIIIFNGDKMFIHQRHPAKYHSGGLWTNACCSHQRQGETIQEAAYRRVYEELGIKDIKLLEIDTMSYIHEFTNGLTEHEYDYLFIGYYDKDIKDFDPLEVNDTKWVQYDELLKDVKDYPQNYTYWFKLILEKIDFTKYLHSM